MTIVRLFRIVPWVLLAVVCEVFVVRASAQTATEIRYGGDPANRVDLVIVGDGYTAAEIGSGEYAMDVETFTQNLFLQDPYKEYQSYYNVTRVDVASAQSGADHPHSAVYKNTAFDASYDCNGIQWLICVSLSKVNAALTASGLPLNARDAVLVVVNDTEYGGSGGAISVSSTNSLAVEIILHEWGHTFGLLADEYGGPPPPACDAAVEPSQVNATK